MILLLYFIISVIETFRFFSNEKHGLKTIMEKLSEVQPEMENYVSKNIVISTIIFFIFLIAPLMTIYHLFKKIIRKW
jgi:hypothetical protein